MKKMMSIIALLLTMVLLTACGQKNGNIGSTSVHSDPTGIKGTWLLKENGEVKMALELKDGNKAVITYYGNGRSASFETSYEIQDKQFILEAFVSITVNSDEITDKYTIYDYTIQGNTLILTNPDKTLVLERAI